MKSRLLFESLEDRRTLSAYTVQISDLNNLVSGDIESKMYNGMRYVMDNISKYISWRGTLEAKVEVRPTDASQPGGVAFSILNVSNGRNTVIQEMQTGVDSCPSCPDVGAVFTVASDGGLKIYGRNAYFDPNPSQYFPANVPAGCFDFIGVMTHEVFHSLGFQLGTNDFSKYVTTVNGQRYFNGPNVVSLLGRSLPMSPWGGTHYGNTDLPGNPVWSGLMFQWGNYGGNRLDIGKLDLMVLKDLGVTVITTDGLPVVDMMDSQAATTTISQTTVNENVPVGTVVGTFSTTQGASGYSWQLVAGDTSSFQVVGNQLVTNAQIDYETKSSYSFVVRSINNGVWVNTNMTIRVGNLLENPQLAVPGSISTNGAVSLGCLTVLGDNNTVTLTIFSNAGKIESTINDPAVRVYLVANSSGGMTACLIGLPSAISRNTRFLTFRGTPQTLYLDLSACIGGVCRSWGHTSINLAPQFNPVVTTRVRRA